MRKSPWPPPECGTKAIDAVMTARVGLQPPLGSVPDSVKPCCTGKTANAALREHQYLLSGSKLGDQVMAEQQLMQAIGRIERALSRLEQTDFSAPRAIDDSGLSERHEQLKAATVSALADIDRLLAKEGM
jgi:hypothetical protein